MYQLKNKTILITSNEEWGDIWFSKHNYAYELSKNNKVIFFNPVHKWSIKNFFTNKVVIKEIKENLFVLNYNNRLPLRSGLLFKLNERWLSKNLRYFFNKQNLKLDLLFSFDPFRITNPKKIGVSKSVYFCVDDYAIDHYGEKVLLSNVDAFISISKSLNNVFKGYNQPLLTISHGISSEEFATEEVFQELNNYGLYIGMIDHRVDFQLANQILDRFSDIDFVFVGGANSKEIKELKLHRNFHFLGPKPFKELKKYIKPARFCLAPMNQKSHGNNISHHKIFQYLAFGKPIFSNIFSEYLDNKELFYMNDDSVEFLKNIEEFIKNGEDPFLMEKRRKFAETMKYENILSKIELFLRENKIL